MKCITCQNEDFKFLYSNYKKPSVRIENYPLDVLICKNCGLVCLDTTNLTEQDLDAYYSNFNAFDKPGPLHKGLKAIRDGQVKWILENLPENHNVKSVLDVGCGNGYVLTELKAKGFQVFGNDMSQMRIDYLRDAFDIDGVVGPFEKIKLDQTFDYISCITVLEHLLDPTIMLKNFYNTLNDQGYLYVEVPDSEFPNPNGIPDHIAFMHLFHWTENTIGRLLEEQNFEIVKIDHIGNKSGYGNPGNNLRVLAQKVSYVQSPKYKMINDFDREVKVLEEYKQKHNEFLDKFPKRIEEVKNKVGGNRIAIYCGGEHTSALLDRFDFSGFEIGCIYDSDTAISGKDILGYKIKHSSEIKDDEIKHFLLSTTNYEREIYESIKEIDPECKVYGLYNQLD